MGVGRVRVPKLPGGDRIAARAIVDYGTQINALVDESEYFAKVDKDGDLLATGQKVLWGGLGRATVNTAATEYGLWCGGASGMLYTLVPPAAGSILSVSLAAAVSGTLTVIGGVATVRVYFGTSIAKAGTWEIGKSTKVLSWDKGVLAFAPSQPIAIKVLTGNPWATSVDITANVWLEM